MRNPGNWRRVEEYAELLNRRLEKKYPEEYKKMCADEGFVESELTAYGSGLMSAYGVAGYTPNARARDLVSYLMK